MQFILSQKETDIFSIGNNPTFNVAVKDGDYAIYARTGKQGERGEMSFVLGYFKSKEKLKYVMHQLFEALSNGDSYEIPKEEEIPDLRIVSGHGVMTSRRTSHGGS